MSSLQEQIIAFWNNQTTPKKITIISLALAALILAPVLVNWVNTPSYSVAYSGLGEADAAEIVQKLDESGVSYKLSAGGIIEVPSDQVYSARLLMASAGLPQSNTVGYELFSGSSMLGMTEFSQQVNYQRAIEGELERTIGSLDAVQAVRVHLVTPEKSLLTTQQALSTASVTLQVRAGHTLNNAQVQAITHLVASSVESLDAKNVVVVDSAGNMLASGIDAMNEVNLSVTNDQYLVEKAYADEVQQRVQEILDKILGPNRAVVQAAVEMDWTQRETTSNMYQPTQVAVRSSQTINESSGSGTTVGGVPGATTNLPAGTATPIAGTDSTSYARSEETINYEISQIQSHEINAPGKVTRLSVSVMVDGITDPVQLESIKQAVQAAAGIDAERGDQVVVESFAFDRSVMDALGADLAAQQQQELYLRIAAAVGVALVVLALLVYALRQINNTRNASKQAWKTIMQPVGAMSGGSSVPMGGSIDKNALYAPIEDDFYKLAAEQLQGDLSSALDKLARQEGGSSLGSSTASQLHSKYQQAVAAPEDKQREQVISRLAEEDPASVAEIIQVWLSEDKG
jgi:flagellar M-ring protein FliF